MSDWNHQCQVHEENAGANTTCVSEASQRILFPFSAIVGQEQMKLALLLNAVCPEIGGVLIRGEKGTAKSTAARALAELLPPVTSAMGTLAPAPFMDLPLGATEDRVIGSIDLEKALVQGKASLQPGILAKVNNGILYIDEVNLLDDHLVDSILDVAESGINCIEREGLSASHDSKFLLIGTMNPEEGDLRPQLLDRFSLAVEVLGESQPEIRKQLLLRREDFDHDPHQLRKSFAQETGRLRKAIAVARKRLKEVFIPKHLLGFITEICSRNHVAGHRADLVISHSACALAAWKGRTEVQPDDITTVAPMALLHRMRSSEAPDMPPPPPEPPQNEQSDEDNSDSPESEPNENEEPTSPPPGQDEGSEPELSGQEMDGQEMGGQDDGDDQPEEQKDLPLPPEQPDDDIQAVGEPFKVKRFQQHDIRNLRSGSGRRNRTRSVTRQGRYIKSSIRIQNNDLALDATLRAAAPYQKLRREKRDSNMAVLIEASDKRGKVREKRIGSFLLFAVDASGSMGAQKRMTETKSAILSLLLDAYQKRDKVAMISFRGRKSELILPPTNSVDLAARLLKDLPVGGRTPLTAALVDIETVLDRALRKEPGIVPMVLLMTDGRANAGMGTTHKPHEEAIIFAARLGERFPQTRFMVVDTEPPGLIRLGLAEKIAIAMGAEHFKTADLKAEDLIDLTKPRER